MKISNGSNYALTQNLVYNGTGTDPEWFPITLINGIFNGSDYTISGLPAPLFNKICATATITRLGVLGSTLAYTNDGAIFHSYATGNRITARDRYLYNTTRSVGRFGGGLVGINNGLIADSHAIGNIKTVINRLNIGHSGGLVGANHGIIARSYAIGNSAAVADKDPQIHVHNSDGYSGGLAGTNSGMIIDSYAIGNSTTTTGESGIGGSGGLVGMNTGGIIYSYALGSSRTADESISHSGGLVGMNTGGIIYSYATGNSNSSSHSDSYSGGLVGMNTGLVIDSYATGDSSSNGSNISSSGGLIGWNDSWFSVNATYATGYSHSFSDTGNNYSGGLVGWNNGSSIINNSYRVQDVLGINVNPEGSLHRTLDQLHCGNGRNATCEGTTAFIGWNTTVWNFGDNHTLPIITSTNMLTCPRAYPNCRHHNMQTDQDGDGVSDAADNCLILRNHDQINNDIDLFGDACDADDDNDGINDYYSNGTAYDNCRTIANSDQNNTITPSSALGDACDDPDGDGIYDLTDNCPWIANPDQNNTITPSSALGDACDDPDGDGIYDLTDNCPWIANPDQNNTITPSSALGDACDDPDGDGIYDLTDNCPRIANQDQNNTITPSSALGDACDDPDNDTIVDVDDNCPTIANPNCEPIANVTDLQNIPNNATGYYLLTANLTINTKWNPINDFLGTFDGNNYVLANLSAPLFNTTGSEAFITRVGVLGSSLARENNGTITHSYATGNSSCSGTSRYSGGLVGRNDGGTIIDSYATGNSSCSGTHGISGGAGWAKLRRHDYWFLCHWAEHLRRR